MSSRVARVTIAGLLALSLAACSGSVSSPQGASSPPGASDVGASSGPSQAGATLTPKPSGTPGPGDVVYSGEIAIGGGRVMQVRCVGVGTPTVLLEGGGTSPGIDAFPLDFVELLAKTTTTCQYSHAGVGTSTALPGTRTMAADVSDAYGMLAALKDQANVQGPFVFVGWSFGGAVALAEALAHPEQTKGLAILDTDFIVDSIKNCLALGRTKNECQKDYNDDIDAKSLETELLKSMHPLPNVPLRIVSAMRLTDCDPSKPSTLHTNIEGQDVTAKDCATLAKRIAELQLHGWSTINPAIGQTMVQADHDGLIAEAGDQIASIILDLVRAARSGS